MKKEYPPERRKRNPDAVVEWTSGRTTFTVHVHFGNTPLERILKERVLADRDFKD
jgi:hypothetical protein